MKKKVLLDFDIGSEADDAIALAYLLANPDCELVGITTSTGESIKRAQLASVMCKAAGQDIPIYSGCEDPLLVEQLEVAAPQARILDDWPHDTEFEPGAAVPFMRDIIRKHPGEITLLGIAPLSNIGALFAIDSEIPSLLDGLMLMGSSPTHHRHDLGIATEDTEAFRKPKMMVRLASEGLIENNCFVDPHGTHIVHRANVLSHRIIGNNVTTKMYITPQKGAALFQDCKHPVLAPLMAIMEEWYKDEPRMSFHDPIAAVCIFNDDICTYERGQMTVELDSKWLKGLTYWMPDEAGPHEIAVEIDKDKFFEHLVSVFQNR